MGKTKIATIDDSAPVESKDQKSKIKKEAKKQVVAPDVTSNEGEAISNNQDSTDSLQNDKGADVKKAEKKEAQKPGKRDKVRSKKYQEAIEKVDRGKNYTLTDGVKAAQSASYSKFDGTIEVHLNTNVKNIRGLVNLPFTSGKKLRIIAFGNGADDSGADIVGSEESFVEMGKGKINFDVVVTTPAWMPKLAKVAKYLGPRGLMPNPKSGTITDDLKKAVTELQSGKTEYKSEAKGNVIHLGVGKVSQNEEELSQNIKVLIQTIGKSRIKKAVLSPTMGPGVKLDLSSI